MDKLLTVKILTPTKTIFQGQATSISSTDSAGKFDILPQHANFISIIDHSPIEVRTPDGKMATFNFSQAIIYNRSNIVNIFAEPLG